MEENKDVIRDRDLNPDPITGAPGSHPIGTGVGAAGVGTAATAVGAAVGGPVGAAVGAVVGAVAGGLLGKGVAEQIDPTAEEAYWRDTYRDRPYTEADYDYDDYSPAYSAGYDGYANYGSNGMTYADAEPRLREDYEKRRGTSRLDWDKAKPATEDAWNRADAHVKQGREHDEYWRNNYASRPYATASRSYDDYAPAYWTGYGGYRAYGAGRGMTFEEAEPELRKEYERSHQDGLGWDDAKAAIKDAWHRTKDVVTSDNHSRRSS
ncbi:MAG: glycine zipper family protein [Cyanobacteria bacterium P01_A01_bin.135]